MKLPPGVLLIDKPEGPTSHDVVSRVRKAAGIRRVGHAGTLDPFASGLLLVLLGPATRLSEYLLGLDKEYQATARLGIETTTHDLEGEVVFESREWSELSEESVADALASFEGTILQQPPVFSAKKVQGEPAHRRARRGEDVELKAVEVNIRETALEDMALPDIRFRVRCSSGTYIRALGRDLGRALNVGGHLTALRRTAIGDFAVEESLQLDALQDEGTIRQSMVSPAMALSHLPSVEVTSNDAVRIRHGQFLPVDGGDIPDNVPLRILLDGNLLGVGALREGFLRPRKVLSDD